MLNLLFTVQLFHYLGFITNQHNYTTLFPSIQENDFEQVRKLGFLINIQTDTALNSPVDIKVNGKKTTTFVKEPILLYLQRGDVLEIDATPNGHGILNISIPGQSKLPIGWPDNLTINNKRYRFPPIL